jgi:putative sterol carrier protein
MISIETPKDVLGISISNILNSRKDQEFYELVKDYNKKIVINITDLYAITILFEGEEIRLQRGEMKKSDIKLTTDLKSLLDLAFGRIGMVSAVLTRKLKVKGLWKIRALLKLIKILFKPMTDVANNPNQNYYEQEKEIR